MEIQSNRALGSALNTACSMFGDALALTGTDSALTYAMLGHEAERVSSALHTAGIIPNEPVHVHVSNHPLDIAALLGVWNAGGVVVPVHRTTPAAVAAKVLDKTRARLLIDMQASTSTSSSASVVSMIATASPPDRPLLHKAAFIIFTSGSTGTPKGVVVSHDAFYGKIQQIDSLLKFQPNENTLLVLNITFSFGLWISLLTLLRGGTLVMAEKFDPVTFLQSLVDNKINRVGMVPTMMRVLFSDPGLASKIDRVVSQNTLRQILIGGESLGHSLAATIRQRFSDTDLIDIYGLTETATCDFFSFPEDYAKYPGCIGRPSPNVGFRIVDAYDAVVPAGALGELQIRSPYLMSGYLDEPDLTTAALSDGWLKTGDLARTVSDSVVELMGRSKEIISRGGNKVTPGELEQLLCSHPDISAAMAVGLADAVLGERIHVLVVPRTGVCLEISALKKYLESRLEKFKQPDTYYLSDALPLGRTGKADRGQLKMMIQSGAIVSAAAGILASAAT
ncbi:class I adenylate-forming enzyme family protein [Glaciimonas sp. PAMC28666]|uniref:class I adenylate-forming enzyme family protein n=1 Tax=Glaciimonas sp. PAMC28666 TaxID=2807626 RepID=UPI001966526B|nr:class I adenylate-forming enzyme family protein [Glaciimonas sp. PAMC28666]QRX80842.1 acyl--CoA ligase [Glaciimonas sp. PAMC28666]